MSLRQRLSDLLRSVRLAARLVAGRFFWILALVPLLWTAFHALTLAAGGREEAFGPRDAQNFLIAMPLIMLAIFLGVRVIAGEVDARRLEIAYTVPGGSQRVWIAKLLASLGILILAEVILAVVSYAIFTSFPLTALYGALQAAIFYLVLAMGLGALFKSEVTGAMLSAFALAFNLTFATSRFSPMFNPLAVSERIDDIQVLGWAVQNRVGFVLVIAALIALAFGRAERREKMLAG